MDMHLARYRKLITFLVTAAIVYALQSVGLTADALPQFGLDVFGLSDQVADFLIQYGPPAVMFVAQPNGDGESLWQWRSWVVAGAAVLVAAIALVLVL